MKTFEDAYDEYNDPFRTTDLNISQIRAIRALHVLCGRKGFDDWFWLLTLKAQDDIFQELCQVLES